jgi:hypothetical protein
MVRKAALPVGLLAVLLASTSLACAGSRLKVAAFKLEGDTLKRVIEPGPNAIVADQHYVSIAIEEVRIHQGSLPKPLALQLKVTGILPGTEEFQAILGTAKNPEDDGNYKFLNPVVISPFVYKGQPIIVEVALAPCTEDWAKKIEEAKREWGGTRHVDPNEPKKHPIDATHLGTDGSDWLKAIFGATQDPSALPLVAGKYVVFAHQNPLAIADKVTFDDRGLVWKESNDVVKGVSFVTLFVNRRKRGPRRDSPMEQTRRAAETAVDAGRIEDARAAMSKLPDLIDKNPSITQAEKDLYKAQLKVMEMLIERKAALDAKDKATLAAKTDEVVAAMNDIMKKFADMLEPFEINKMKYDIRRYEREKNE